MMITTQPVAELYVLHIYLFIYFPFVCVCWKASQLSTRRGPTVLQVYFFSTFFLSFCFSLSLSSPQGCRLTIYAQCVSNWSSSFKKQSSLAEPAPNLDTKSILGKTLWRITNVISAGTLFGAIAARRPKHRWMMGYGSRMQCNLSRFTRIYLATDPLSLISINIQVLLILNILKVFQCQWHVKHLAIC